MKITIYPQTQGLIFDIDGTLADTMPIHYEAWQDVLKTYGLSLSYDDFLSMAGIPGFKIAETINRKLNAGIPTLEATRMKEQKFINRIEEVKAIDEVTSIVYEYHKKFPMTAGTGGRRHIAEMTIKAIGLEGYFTGLVSSDDVKAHKPAPDTFIECSKIMNVPPENCQVFEDGDAGIEAARRAGMLITDVRDYL